MRLPVLKQSRRFQNGESRFSSGPHPDLRRAGWRFCPPYMVYGGEWAIFENPRVNRSNTDEHWILGACAV